MSDDIKQCLDGIHRIEISLIKLQTDVEINTDDLSEHIKRTDLLEKKLSKVYVAAYVGIGILLAEFGPDVLKILGLL